MVKKFELQLLRLKTAVGVTGDQDIAALLGLSKAAFSDRKKRDAFPEDKLRALAATRPELGIDVNYVLTGEYLSVAQAKAGAKAILGERRSAVVITEPGEIVLLEAYRALPKAMQKRVLAFALDGETLHVHREKV